MGTNLGAKARFGDRVEAYVASRPDYPDELYDRLLEGRSPDRCVIAELGSGSGIFASPLVGRGYRVLGVEPNPRMRAAAERFFAGNDLFTSIDGSAERTTLSAGSIGLVISAQAFHWFDFEDTRAEVSRILEAQGTVAWVWNSRRTAATDFARDYEAFLEHWAVDYLAVRDTYRVRERLGDFFPDSPLERSAFDHHQLLDRDGFRERVLSASYLPSSSHERFAAMLQAADELFERHQEAGRVRLDFDSELFWQRRP